MRSRQPMARRSLGAVGLVGGVSEQLEGRVAAIDTHHASAGIRAGAAQEHAGHRGARGETTVPHILWENLALEYVSAREPDPLLNVRRPQNFHVYYGLRKIRGVSL